MEAWISSVPLVGSVPHLLMLVECQWPKSQLPDTRGVLLHRAIDPADNLGPFS